MKTTRAFKSGNSTAVRLPKSFGVEPGTELALHEEQGRYIIEPLPAEKRKFNVAKVAGSATNLVPIKDEDRLFEPRPLFWGERPAER
jgi:antitoxin VapB